MSLRNILKELESRKDLRRGKFLERFFRCGKGEYGEGDIFWGLSVPISRKIAKKYLGMSMPDISKLLKYKVHEARLIALFLLIHKYKTSPDKKKIVDFYLAHSKYVNNWDLVDTSAYNILGVYLSTQKDKSILLKLAKSGYLWEERIAIVSTWALIKKGDSAWTFKLAQMFLNHKHDLIHKATGWMLREAGKRGSGPKLQMFLDKHASKMPRTMLRYSIEKFPELLRKKYLNM